MKDALVHRIPAMLAAAMTVVTVSNATFTFGAGSTGWGLPICLALTAAGLVVSDRLTEGYPTIPRGLLREINGALLLVAAFALMLLATAFGKMPVVLRGWEAVVGATCLFTFLLASLRSFLMHAALNGFLLLTALLFRPSMAVAGAYLVLFAAQSAVLFRREIEEEARGVHAPGQARIRFAGPGVSLLLLVLLLAAFHAVTRDPGPTIADLVEPPPGSARTAIPDRAQPNPVAAWNAALPGVKGEIAGVAFDRDLRFGDVRSDDGGLTHPENVVLVVQLRDMLGDVVRDPGSPLYWRAGAVSVYSGREWIADPGLKRTWNDGDDGLRDGWVTLQQPRATGRPVELRVLVSPLAGRTLFLLYPPDGVELPSVAVDGEGTLERRTTHEGRFRYRAMCRPPSPSSSELLAAVARHPESRYLEVPPAIRSDARVQELVALAQRAGPSAHRQARALVEELSGYAYSLKPNLPPGQDPTLAFLRARTGYCQHYASALALVLRVAGLPTRIATGFSKGEWDAVQRVWVARRKDAHAWVEVHYEGIGWIPYDPAGAPVDAFMTAVPTPAPLALVPTAAPTTDPVAPTPEPTTAGTPGSTPRPTAGATRGPRPTAASTPRPTATPEATPAPTPVPAGPSEFDRTYDSTDNRPADEPAGGGPPGGGKAEDGSPTLADNVAPGTWRVSRDVGLALLATVGLAALGGWLWRRWKRRQARLEEEATGEDGRPPRWVLEDPPRPGRPARRDRATRVRVVESYLDFLKLAGRRGVPRTPGMTALELLDAFEERVRPAPPAARELTRLFLKARYDELETTEDDARAADRAVQDTVRQMGGRS